MYTRKTALALARQARTCPRENMMNDPAHAPEIRAHRSICPFCATRRSEVLDACQALGRALEPRVDKSGPLPEIEIGQIRQIQPALACWWDHLFYSPPAVVVVQTPEPGRDEIRVAQIWHDIYLAGPGDLIVPPGNGTYEEPIFIETWNVYSLTRSFLGPCIGKVDEPTIADVLKMNRDQGYLPPAATALLPLEENDPRHFFRKMEIEAGYVLAQMAVRELMDEKAPEPTAEVQSWMGQLRSLVRGVQWSWVPETLEDCFAALRFPDEALALAAADQDSKSYPATHIRMDQGRLTGIFPFYAVIYNETRNDDGYSVSGVFQGLSADLEKTTFACYLVNENVRGLEKGTLSVDPGTLVFKAVFARPGNGSERLHIVASEQDGNGNTVWY